MRCEQRGIRGSARKDYPNEQEKNDSANELELLAVIWTTDKFGTISLEKALRLLQTRQLCYQH